MLSLQNANMDLSEVRDPDSSTAQSGKLSAFANQWGTALPCRLCHENSIYWIELLPCIAEKASSFHSHEQVKLTPLQILKIYKCSIVCSVSHCSCQSPVQITSNLLSLTRDCNSSFHVECLVPLSRICKTYPATNSIIVLVNTGTMLYQLQIFMLP